MRRGNPLIYSAADDFCTWPRALLGLGVPTSVLVRADEITE
jgi:hypothetical protein